MTRLATLENKLVNFRVRDVYLPPAQEVLDELHGSDVLQGRVVCVTEDGVAGNDFVLVQVEGLNRAVVVPLTQILGVV